MIRSVTFDCARPAELARFWSAATGWPMDPEPDPGEAGVQAPPPIPGLLFLPVTEPKTGQNRVHLDLRTTSAADQVATVNRLRGLGAVPADIGQGDVPWVVLADPEGNEFCVLEPRDLYRDAGPVAAIVVHCTDPVPLARFWSGASGWLPLRSGDQWASLRLPERTGPHLEFLHGAAPKQVKNRIHFDLSPTGRGRDAEVERLLGLGAAVLADRRNPDGTGWVVMADPQQNEFCVERSPAERAATERRS
jgi:Glyoxalase-like domain